MSARMAQAPQKPGIRELLLFLKEQGIRTAVASSTRSDLVRKQLCEGKLLSFFDAVIGGDMVERSKPEPDIFLKAMETLAVSPEQSWVIEVPIMVSVLRQKQALYR